MNLHFPAKPLSQYVECFWYVDLRVPYQREIIVPTATVELIINFGSGFKLIDKNNPQRFELNTDSWLVGMQTEHLINEPLAETKMIGVRFKPGGTAPFFQFPASEAHNLTIELEALWGQFANELREELYELQPLAAKFTRLEQLLLSRMHIDAYQLEPISYAVQQIQRERGKLAIKPLSNAVNMSQKHLANQFRKIVGVSPKALARVTRFQHVLGTIDPTQPIDWAHVAQQCHYYDQSHFNRDFAAFAGLTPSQYIENRRAVFGDSLQQGADVHFVPIG